MKFDQGTVLFGAKAIALFIHGEDTPTKQDAVYHQHRHGLIPTFKMGKRICMRPAAWTARVAELEARHTPSRTPLNVRPMAAKG